MSKRFPRVTIAVLAAACLLLQGGTRAERIVHAAGPVTRAAIPASVSARRDACLVGIWDVTDYESFFLAVMKHFNFTGTSGTEQLKYTRKGGALAVANHFTLHLVARDTHLAWSVEITGQSAADWRTPHKGHVKYSNIDGNFTEVLTIGPKSSTIPIDGPFGSQAQKYACGTKYLDLWLTPTYPPIILRRLSS